MSDGGGRTAAVRDGSGGPEDEVEWPDCPVCNSGRRQTWLGGVGHHGLATLHLVACMDCGLGYLRPRPTAAALANLYRVANPWSASSDGFRLDPATMVGPKDAPRPPWTNARIAGALTWLALRKKLADQCRIAADAVLPGSRPRVLDVGCGDGAFLRKIAATLRGSGVGIDLGPPPNVESGSVRYLQGSLADGALSAESFDLITAWSYLEHDPTPVATLARMRQLIAPGGKLVIEVPNRAAPPSRLLGRRWPALVVPFHVCFYTPESLSRLLREAGFGDVRVLRRGTAGWQALCSELLLGALAASEDAPLREAFWRLERSSAAVRLGLLTSGLMLKQVERHLGLEGRMTVIAIAV